MREILGILLGFSGQNKFHFIEKGSLAREKANKPRPCWDPFNYCWGCRNVVLTDIPFLLNLCLTVKLPSSNERGNKLLQNTRNACIFETRWVK